jgi:hypothetical protein
MDIAMGTEEIQDFLNSRTEAVVIGLDDNGEPSGGVGQLMLTDGVIGFALGAEDPVVELLNLDARACCVVEQFPSYYEIKGVMLHGQARPAAESKVGEAAFVLDVEQVVSFDFSKLAGS